MRELTNTHLSLDLPETHGISTPGGVWQFHQDFRHDWAWAKDVFSSEELNAIITMGESMGLSKGRTLSPDGQHIRSSSIRWMYPNEITEWVFERMAKVVLDLNNNLFGFDLDGFCEGFQFTKYTAPSQHYDWHCDRGAKGSVRKLSVSLLLSDPDDFDGGDLEIKTGTDDERVSRIRGMATVFPSWTLHRVTPVTRGTRYSLVAWISGPAFR